MATKHKRNRRQNGRHKGAGQAQARARVYNALRDHGLVRKGVLVLSMLLLVSGIAFAGVQMGKTSAFPIRSVQVEGGLKQLDPEQLQQVVVEKLQGNFFSVDIAAIQQAIMVIPWVEHVAVRRVWPDVLRIQVAEHLPLARWGQTGLLNVSGEWFGAAQDGLERLPELHGPEGYQQQMAQRYREIVRMLQPAGLHVVGVYVNQRRSWEVLLDNRLRLRLGRDRHDERLMRFVRMYSRVVNEDKEKIELVDLRYTNGLAVRWVQQTELSTRGS